MHFEQSLCLNVQACQRGDEQFQVRREAHGLGDPLADLVADELLHVVQNQQEILSAQELAYFCAARRVDL